MDALNRILETLKVLLKGVGQVIFQENALSGALMLLGIFFQLLAYGASGYGGNVRKYSDCMGLRLR